MTAPRRSNCLFWAVRMWRRNGGYLLMRRSYHAWWLPHFAWMPPDMGEPLSYCPITPKKHAWDFLRFAGHIVKETGHHAS